MFAITSILTLLLIFKAVAKAKSAASSVEEAVKSLEAAVMAVGGVRLRTAKAKVEGIKEQIDTLQV